MELTYRVGCGTNLPSRLRVNFHKNSLELRCPLVPDLSNVFAILLFLKSDVQK